MRQIRLASLAADPHAFGSTYERDQGRPADWWELWAANSERGSTQRTFVLEADDGRWLGLALVLLDDEQPGSATLNAMWVAPEARGQRAAKQLCDACATWATERGCRELKLAVVASNDPARRAYGSAGFVTRGETTWTRDGRTLDELIMVRTL